ncbi:MAG: methyltransferase domain-containing protein [Eubacterium sp.]
METKVKSELSQDLLAAIFNTSQFKQYSHECRQEVVEELENYQFNSLLDLDCGGGKMLEQIFEKFPKMDAYGFDYSLERLAGARERLDGKNVPLKMGNAQHLPYENAQFDVVVSTSTFHHYPHPEAVLKEVHRVLKPKGILVLCDTYLNATLRYINAFCKALNEVDIKMYSQKEIWDMLNSAGFTGINWRLLNKHAYLATAVATQMPLV